jgi:hypothetical protein
VTELWSFSFKAYQVFPMFPKPLTVAEALRHSVVMAPIQLRETLGYLSWDTVQPPAVAVVCWGLAVAAVVAIGFALSRRAGLLVIVGLAFVVGIPFAMTVAGSLHPMIGEWLGRYTLPLAAGVPLLAVACARAGHGERKIVAALASAAAILVLCGQAAVFSHAWTVFHTVPPATPFVAAPRPTPHLDALIGSMLLLLGALGVLASILAAEFGGRPARPAPEASRPGAASPAPSGTPG